MGNFDKRPPPRDQWDLAVRHVASLCDVLDISPTLVEPHRKYAPYKSCPGKKFDMDLFQEAVEGASDRW